MTAIPSEGIKLASELMADGNLNRYQKGEDTCYLLKCEEALAKYIGMNYALGVNSGASAIFLALKAAGVTQGVKVLTNAFTFNAVPSSITHANGTPVLVECDERFCVDMDDLRKKIDESGAKIFVLSYMRGRIPDMDKIMKVVEELDLYLIEDAAHAYGCEWRGQKIGSFGVSSCLSTQANKVMNSGEGGFLLTNDDHIQAKSIIAAGCYEQYYLKHCVMCPPEELMKKYRMTVMNYSMRMTNLQGAILLPQVALLDKRRERLNAAYEILRDLLTTHNRITIPDQLKEVTPVSDSIQFQIEGVTKPTLRKFVELLKKKHKMKMGVFGFVENARNWHTWKFLEGIESLSLPNTDKYIGLCCDTRLQLGLTEKDIKVMVHKITSTLDDVLDFIGSSAGQACT